MHNVLKPVTEPFTPEAAELLAHYPKRDGYVLQLFRVFANSIRFLKKGTVNLLDRDSPISMREREIVILRVCANNDCEYEWGVHVAAFARHVALTDDQIAATRVGDHRSGCWSEQERLLVAAIDELCALGRIDAPTYRAMQAVWTVEQQLEILALAGNYHTICFVASTAQLGRESFAATFPIV